VKEIKFRIDKTLWERFYRFFPGHGERSAVLRKVVREIVLLRSEETPFEQTVAKQLVEDLSYEKRS